MSVTPLYLPTFHSPKQSRKLIFTCAGIMLLLFLWSASAHVEEVPRGYGRIIPSRQMQFVQAPEGGAVSEVMYYEGEIPTLLHIRETAA